MAVNIGPKIGIDGEKEYRKQINDLITQQKTFSAEMRELESSFDDSTSAMEKSRKKGEVLEKQIKNQEKQVEELEKGLKASAEKYGENATETQKWKQAVANAKTTLNKMQSDLDKLPKSLENVGKSMQNAGKKMKSVGDTLTKKVTAPIAALGAASIAAWNEVDEGLDIVVKKTGATGQALEDLQESAKTLATTMPTSFEAAGSAIGEVNTRFGLTGTELEDLSGKFIKFAELNDTDVSSSVDNVQKVMAAFGLETSDAGALLDALNKTGQNTGISMDTLETSMIKNAAALQDMGMDAFSAASFLGDVETSGANTETVMSGLTKALSNANEEGKTLPEALGEFQGIMASSASDQEKLNAAIELFGKKAGPAIYKACSQGSLSFESLSTDADTYLGSVETTFDSMLDPADQFTITMNKLKGLGAEVGGVILENIAPAAEEFGKKVEQVATWFGSLDTKEQDFVVNTIAAFAIGGPVLSAFGNVVDAAGKVVTAVGNISGSIGLLTSPAGLGILAVGGLAFALNTMDRDVGYLDGDVQTLVTNTSSVVGELDSATGSLQETMEASQADIDAINAQADVAGELITELEGLEKQSSLTAEQQARMKTIVGQLNAMYPNLSLSIDESTGKLNKGTREIRNYVENARRMSLLEAYTKASKAGYEKLAEASIALQKARKQEADNLEVINGLEAEKAELDNLLQDSTGNVVDAAGNFVMTYDDYEQKLTEVSDNIETATSRQEELTSTTEEAQAVYDEAETTITEYEQAADDLAGQIEETKQTTEEDTAAMESNTAAAESNTAAVKLRAAELTNAVATALSKLGEESKAWDDLYQATRDSIDKQIGLFDEWEQETELTASGLLKNLQSQTKGMTNYADNMKRLSAEAVKSSDPNFKALVQSINDMGVDGAAYAQLLVDAMDNDKDTFNSILSEFGANSAVKDNLAEVETYISSDFKTKTDAAVIDVITSLNALGKTQGFQSLKTSASNAFTSVQTTFQNLVKNAQTTGTQTDANLKKGYSGLPATASAAAQQASSSSKQIIDGTNYDPSVKSIDVPESVTTSATNKISAKLKPTAKVESVSVSDAAEKARSALQTWFNNNPITATIKQLVQKVSSPTHHAEGGFTNTEQLSWLSEGNQPEVVIPLSSAKRSRALDLYQQTGEILGVDSIVQQSTVVTFPGGQQINSTDNLRIGFDADQIYAAVAAGAAHGLENANVRIYWDNREAGRIMRDMGVQFA